MNRTVLVARQEFDTTLRTRSFVAGTVLAVLVLAGFVLSQSSLFDRHHRSTIGLAGQAIAVAGELTDQARQVGREVRTVEVTNLASGARQVADGSLDALVSGAPAALTVLVNRGLDDELRGVLTALVRQQVLQGQLAALNDLEGLDADTVLTTVAEAHVEVKVLSPADPADRGRLPVALVLISLVFLAVLLYASLVAQRVVEERSARIGEFLLPAASPAHLLGGKLAGLALVGLVQFTIVGVAGLVTAVVADVLPGPGIAVAALAWGLVWFVLGFVLYAMVFTVAGVSRQDTSTLAPVVLVVAFLVCFALLTQNAAGGTTTVLSLLPPLSPILMPGRLALAAVPVWQVALSLVLTALTAAVLVRYTPRVYLKSLLRNT